MNKNTKKISTVFIIGAKSIGKYGGYETFVDYLLTYHQNFNDIKYFSNIIHSHKGKIYINTDGLEWKRLNWNYFIRKYLKFSEKLMVKYSDLVICDNKNNKLYSYLRKR